MRALTLLSAEEFSRVAPVLGSCELINGEIVAMSPGGARHSLITGNAHFFLSAHARRLGLGRVLTGEAGFIVARKPDTVRGADVAFISYQRLPKPAVLTSGFLEAPPELIIEVLSDDVSWEEMERKIAEYHRFGVDLVWVLDPRSSTLHAYPRESLVTVLHETDTVSAHPVVPDFTCPVSAFFAS